MSEVDPKLPTEVARALGRLRAALIGDPSRDAEREVAVVTGGLPVYTDMGGTLAITEDGRVVRYHDETADATEEEDERWRKLARIAAAERYPDLVGLRPQRTEGAKECAACAGKGKLAGSRCAMCLGLGWTSS